jgi:hypothetical protein
MKITPMMAGLVMALSALTLGGWGTDVLRVLGELSGVLCQ